MSRVQYAYRELDSPTSIELAFVLTVSSIWTSRARVPVYRLAPRCGRVKTDASVHSIVSRRPDPYSKSSRITLTS